MDFSYIKFFDFKEPELIQGSEIKFHIIEIQFTFVYPSIHALNTCELTLLH